LTGHARDQGNALGHISSLAKDVEGNSDFFG
jgi:hypothetical protein